MKDAELLQDFAEHDSESAFRALVDRHSPLVFGTARRITGNGTLAEEIAQTVFLLLARKARSFNPEAVLTGWLFRTTRFVSARALRTEQRRRRYEEAAAMDLQTNLDPHWPRVAPQLDDALARLNETDRHAILLRFFDQCGRRDLAEALGVSEEAAKKRVTRALERLRRILSRRGFDLSATALMAGLGHEGASAALPAGLNGQITSIVIAKLAAGGAAGVSGTALLTDVLSAMRWAKIKLTSGVGAGVLAAILLITSVVRDQRPPPVVAPPDEAALKIAPKSGLTAGQPASPTDLDDTIEINGERLPRRTLRLKVLDGIGGDPIAGAAVMHIFLVRPNESSSPEPLRTDQHGIAEVHFPERFPNDRRLNQFQVSVRADGYAPREVMWLSTTGGVLQTVAPEYTVRLETGIMIGAEVVDDAGQRLSGVAVGLVANNYRGYSVSTDPEGNVVSPPEVRVDEFSSFGLAANSNVPDAEVTDQSGRFQIAHFPSDLAALLLELATPDGSRHKFRTPQGSRLSSEALPEIAFLELKAGTARIVLPRGVTVDGLVVDAEGHAVPGATVVESVMIGNLKELSRSVADPEGRFQLANRGPREVILSAAAIGHASAAAIVRIAPGMAPIRLQLPPEQPLRGRVTAEDGAPLTGARVTLVDYRNDGLGLTWNDTTDGDGRFVWRGAPTNEVVVSATATGYAMRMARLKPSATEHVITLRVGAPDTVRVTGRVTDAVTGELVEHFFAKVYDGLSGSLPQYLKRVAEGQNGGFETEVRMSDYSRQQLPSWVLLIEAENYEPLVTRVFDPMEGDQSLDLQLQPGGRMEGAVQTPEGTPAAGARLAFAQEGDPVLAVRDGEFSQRSEKSLKTSDTSGRFRLIKPPKATALVVFHDSGWAIVPAQPGAQKLHIQLQAWAMVEGVLILKGAPAPDEQIGLSSLGLDECLALQVLSGTTTDAQGQFSFRKVPAREFSLSHRPRTGPKAGQNHSVLETLQTTVIVRAGETRTVTLGGSGRSVVARLQWPTTVPATGWTNVLAVLRRDVSIPSEPSPAQYATFASLNAAIRNRSRDSAYLAARREERTYSGTTQPDGTTTFDDVSPGRMVLDVKLFDVDRAKPNAFGDAPVKARLRLAVNVPETSSPAGEPFDLGRFTLEPMQ